MATLLNLGGSMIWPFEGTLFSSLILILILVDIVRNKDIQPLLRERFFSRILMTYLFLFSMETLFIFLLRLDTTRAADFYHSYSSLRFLFQPTLLFLWFHYALYNLRLKKSTLNILYTVFALPWAALLLLSIQPLMTSPLFPTLSIEKIETFEGYLCLFYAVSTFLITCFIPSVSVFQKTPFIPIVSFPLILGSLFKIATGSSFFITIFLAIAPLSLYFVVQSWKITFDMNVGLPNRKAFNSELAKLFKYREKEGTILLIDVENFKFYNQKFSQKIGDALLNQLGSFLSDSLRKFQVYHLYGDQFAVLLKACPLLEAHDLSERLLKRFSRPWVLENASVLVNIRMVLVNYPHQVCSAEEAINAMDFTLSVAKHGEVNVILEYDQSLLEKKLRSDDVGHCLFKAIGNKKIDVYYQPIYDCKSETFTSAEALSRINDCTLGALQPDEFIPVAETSGLIVELTYQVMASVCRLFHRMEKHPSKLKRISINLSAVHFLHPDMASEIIRIVKENGIKAEQIDLEFTESSVVQSFERIEKLMFDLSQEGFTFSLDDYGTGYSNIEYLMNMPFTSVKLDKKIIANYKTHRELLESLIFMLHRIGKEIVAEGVETEEQFQVLKSMGVDRIQGYLFSRPIESQAFIGFLTNAEQSIHRDA